MSMIKTTVSKILNFNNEPSKRTEGQFWYDTNNNVLKRSDGTTYTPISVGDNLISVGSTETLKTVLNNKAEKSDLSNYLKKTGDNYLELGNLNSSGTAVILGSNFAEEGEDFYGDRIELRGSGINVIIPDEGGTEIYGHKISINNPNNEIDISLDSGFTGTFIDNNLATELEDGHIATSKAIKSYVDTSVSNKANTSDVVTLTGDQTISGSKTFNNITIDNLNGNTTDVDGVKISTNTNSIELYAAAYTDESNTPYNNIFTKIDAKKLEISNSTSAYTESIQIDASNIKFTAEDAVFDINVHDGINIHSYGGSFGNTTNITSDGILLQNNGMSIITGGSQVIITPTSQDAVSQIIGSHNLVEGADINFVGYSIGTGFDDLSSGDISNFKNNTIFSVGYSYTTDEVTPEILGSLVDKTISSSSLDTHIPTSKAVYTALQSKADNTNVVHLSGDEVITGNKTFTSSIRFSSGDTFNTNLAAVSIEPPVYNPGTPPTLIIDSNSNITIDASTVIDTGYYHSYGIISGVNWDGETFRIDGKYGSASFSSLSTGSISGSAVVSTLGTSTTSSKLPTEGAVVKAISDVKTSLGSALTYEGSVENYSNLPTGLTTSDKGKVYNVVNANGNIPAGTNYAWNGTSWDALGGDYTALKDYIDDSVDDKITKNTDAELNAFIMPTYNSSGVQNGKAKITLYKDDTTGAITIEAEEIIE